MKVVCNLTVFSGALLKGGGMLKRLINGARESGVLYIHSSPHCFRYTHVQQKSYNNQFRETTGVEHRARPSLITDLMHDVRRQKLCNLNEPINPLYPLTGRATPLRVWYASVSRPMCTPKQPCRRQTCGKVGYSDGLRRCREAISLEHILMAKQREN